MSLSLSKMYLSVHLTKNYVEALPSDIHKTQNIQISNFSKSRQSPRAASFNFIWGEWNNFAFEEKLDKEELFHFKRANGCQTRTRSISTEYLSYYLNYLPGNEGNHEEKREFHENEEKNQGKLFRHETWWFISVPEILLDADEGETGKVGISRNLENYRIKYKHRIRYSVNWASGKLNAIANVIFYCL